ncbi:MAG: hypothetical protein IPJ40_06235 [Saprospirales bacterium]|nr:hypothetical protein [Saprospirales bacterium]
MNRNFFSILLFFVLAASWSCQSNDRKPGAASGTDTSALSGLEQLRAQAVDENDIYGRLRATVSILQDEFSRSEAAMPGLKKVSVEIDANCLLTISNKAFGDEMTRVNLQALDPNGFSLIPDLNEGDFPGLRVRTLGGKPAVELLKRAPWSPRSPN